MARVLLIDDDATISRTFRELLTLSGYECYGARTGREGVRMAEALQPDVTIVDLGLPDISGLDVLAQIRALARGTASVVLTGFWDLSVEFESKRLGACACLCKPIFADEVIQMVERAVASTAQSEALRPTGERSLQAATPHALARIADRVVLFVASPEDAPTLKTFGQLVGVSRGCFRNWCKTARLKANMVHGFARALRAVERQQAQPGETLENVLNSVDRRTIRKFCRKSGVASDRLPATVDELLRSQEFVQNPAFLSAIRSALARTGVRHPDRTTTAGHKESRPMEMLGRGQHDVDLPRATPRVRSLTRG